MKMTLAPGDWPRPAASAARISAWAAGEAAARDALERAFPGSVVEDRSGASAQGDLWWTPPTRARPILVEVKNYAGALPQRELDKFHRDIARNRPALGGALLVCYGCPSVPTLPGKLWFGFADGLPVASVCEAEDNLPAALAAFVLMLDYHDTIRMAHARDGDFMGKLLASLLDVHARAAQACKDCDERERKARLSSERTDETWKMAQRQATAARANADAARVALDLMRGAVVPAEEAAEPEESEAAEESEAPDYGSMTRTELMKLCEARGLKKDKHSGTNVVVRGTPFFALKRDQFVELLEAAAAS